MKSTLCLFAAVLGFVAFEACQQAAPAPAAPKPLTMGELSLNKKDGKDCDKPDTLRHNCAEITLKWPEVKDGSEALKKNVADWSADFLISVLVPSETPGRKVPTLEIAVDSFIRWHRESVEEGGESMLGYYVADFSDTVLLNDGKYLTLFLAGYVFTGGAHGGAPAAVKTFDVASGKALELTDMVTDTAALRVLAEKKFREARAEVFEPGPDGEPAFTFDDTFRFTLPQAYGWTDQGLYLFYQQYEVGPYALGTTDFVIPFAELGALRKQ